MSYLKDFANFAKKALGLSENATEAEVHQAMLDAQKATAAATPPTPPPPAPEPQAAPAPQPQAAAPAPQFVSVADFSAFQNTVNASLTKINESITKLATAGTPQATPKGTPQPQGTQQNLPMWVRDPRNAALVAKLKAKGVDLQNYNPVTGQVEEIED